MKKILSLVLVAALLLSMAGCGGKRTGNNSPAITAKPPQIGPVGVWDIPIPEINPLGSQSLYTTTSYQPGERTVKYIEKFAECEKTISGEAWFLEVKDDSGVPLYFLKEYAQKLGAHLFSNQYGDRLVFNMKKDENSLWWGDAQLKEDGYLLWIVKELYVPVGREVKFLPKALGDEAENISFVTTSEGKRFQTATVKIPDGALELKIESYYSTGIVKRSVYYQRELPAKKTGTFVLDDLPQGADSLKWTFTWEEDSVPGEFSVLLEEIGDLPPLKLGNELGALKVCGVPFGSAAVEPPFNVDITHADGYSLEGDLTPEGETLFWLPAGYWNVVLTAEGVGLADSKARLVPVSSGETTILTFPASLKSAYADLNRIFAEAEELAGGIEMVEAKDQGKTASLSLLVHDPQNRDIFPTKENTTIFEGGKQVKITEITRQIAPPSVVLVLDSSGSMGKQMKATLDAAKKFINGLPDKSFIKVVDFDSGIRVLSGDTKEAVSTNLAKITSGGSTKLFDATLEGLKILEGKSRPALVLFADGADSSLDGQGEGSYATKEEVLEAIAEAKLPLFTIGFGDKPDEKALREFSQASGGEYYSAKDEKALANVFASIGSKFGNSFVMTYERPGEAGFADTPVISFIMDASGSMDIDPAEEEGCGFRMDKTKALFHDFILKLPEKCLLQMISFQTNALGGRIIRQQQITDSDKMKILQGLGELRADGGTPILEAIQIGYENLRSVPSNKKVIVYLTDAALEVDEEEQEAFENLLGEIKKDNITVLWAGMGVQDKKEVFAKAAELSGGRYVVSEDADGLQSTLEEILALLKEEKPAGEIPLSIAIDDKSPSGALLSYAANFNVAFTRPPKSGEIIEPDAVKLVAGLPLQRYGKNVAELVTGTGVPGLDTILSKRILFTTQESNKAMELTVKEAFYFSKFKGLEPPANKQFLALQLGLKNVTPEKIQYQIPSFNNHFYVNINNEGSYPASNATWLTETPLSPPGNPEINVFPGTDLTGMLMFLVPDVPITQTSLHFYDIVHGHINLPLIGKMDGQLLEVGKLPATDPVRITDAFSMTLKGSSDVEKIDLYKAEDSTSFRIVEADFNSKVQALLDINPSQRLWLKINTNRGPFMTRMSDVTAALPFGFLSPVMLAPAANNKVRFAYPVANGLSGTQAQIWGDLEGGSLEIPLVKGSPHGNSGSKATASTPDLQVRINELARLNSTIEGYGENWVVADVTFSDTKGGFGSLIPVDCFQLVRKDYEKDYREAREAVVKNVGLGDFASGDDSSEGILQPDYSTGQLLYGINEHWPVFDGAERRGLFLFQPVDRQQWTLKSPYFPDLAVPLGKEAYTCRELIVNDTKIPLFDQDFEAQLEALVREEIIKYNSTKGASGQAGYTKTVGLGETDGKNNIPMPTIVTGGAEKLQSVKSLSDFTKTMQSLKWLPSDGEDLWIYTYSPEAVLTQGWGTEWDLANLALGLLAKNGYTPKLRAVAPTENGRSQLLELGKISELPKKVLPGISYVDEKGTEKLFVIPFMKDLEELEGLVYLSSQQNVSQYNYGPKSATVRVWAKIEAGKDSAQAVAGDIADILGGGEGETEYYDYLELLAKEMPLSLLSLDAIEVGYPVAGAGKGTRYMAVLSTPKGLEGGSVAVDSGQNKILGLKIDLELPSGTFSHETTLLEGETPDKIYHTLAVNLPDLPEAAAKALEEATKKEYKAAENPNSLSALKWYSRNILNRFIANQTVFDQNTAEKLNLTLGRTKKERAIVLTSRMGVKDNKMRTSMDLLQTTNQCHNGDKKTQAAYNIGAGLFVSSLEGKALTGENRNSYIDLWAKAPKGTSILFIPPDGEDSEMRSMIAADLEKAGYPQRLVSAVADSPKAIFVPDKPTPDEGQKRWAWLEIDPKTYETISVFDTGEHSAYAEYVILKEIQSLGEEAGKYMLGAFIGVDVSIWSVCSASLKLGDYKEILKEAQAIASSVGDYLDYVMKGVDAAANKEFSWGIKVSGFADADYKLKLPDEMPDSFDITDWFEARFKQNLLGFKQGYDDAVNLYFKVSK